MLVVDGKSKTMWLLVLGAAAVSTLSACAETGVPISAPMRLGSPAFAPRGYLQFCERRPDQCGLATPMADLDRANLERTLMQEQWANILNLQPTATAANAGSRLTAPQALPLAPAISERAAPLDLTGALDLSDKQAPSVTSELTVVSPSNPSLDTHALTVPALASALPSQPGSVVALVGAAPAAATSFDAAFPPPVPSDALSAVLQAEIGAPSVPSALLGAGTALAPAEALQMASAADPFGIPLVSKPVLSPTLEAPAVLVGEQQASPAPQPAMLHLTPLVWEALNGVNQSVNAKIRPMDDQQAFGVADYWTLPLSDGPRPVGNCKHYVLEKRKALVEAGFSPNVLSIAIVKTGWGEVHSVLVVDTDQGDYVLDNLTSVIKPWRDVRYTWIERQTPGKPLRWAGVLLGGEAASS